MFKITKNINRSFCKQVIKYPNLSELMNKLDFNIDFNKKTALITLVIDHETYHKKFNIFGKDATKYTNDFLDCYFGKGVIELYWNYDYNNLRCLQEHIITIPAIGKYIDTSNYKICFEFNNISLLNSKHIPLYNDVIFYFIKLLSHRLNDDLD